MGKNVRVMCKNETKTKVQVRGREINGVRWYLENAMAIMADGGGDFKQPGGDLVENS